MRTFVCEFWGRKKGAIGITHSVSIEVVAGDEEHACLACYDTHEHITGGVAGIQVREKGA